MSVSYLPIKSSLLDCYLHAGVVMTADDVSDQPSTTGKADPPPLLPEGGLDAYSVHSDYMKV